MDLDLAGKRVVLTGATGAIGQAVAARLAAEGAELVLVARGGEQLEKLADRLSRDCSVGCSSLPADLSTDEGQSQVAGIAGSIDILINNAGAIPGGNILDIPLAEWRRAWDLKVFGYIALTQAMLRRMASGTGGVIVNNIGAAGEAPDWDYVAGSAGNAALMAFTRAVGGRSLDHGVRVLGVNPGAVESERIRSLLRHKAGKDGDMAASLSQYPAGRLATPAEVADLIVFAASPVASYLSGTIITIDGGMSSRRSI